VAILFYLLFFNFTFGQGLKLNGASVPLITPKVTKTPVVTPVNKQCQNIAGQFQHACCLTVSASSNSAITIPGCSLYGETTSIPCRTERNGSFVGVTPDCERILNQISSACGQTEFECPKRDVIELTPLCSSLEGFKAEVQQSCKEIPIPNIKIPEINWKIPQLSLPTTPFPSDYDPQRGVPPQLPPQTPEEINQALKGGALQVEIPMSFVRFFIGRELAPKLMQVLSKQEGFTCRDGLGTNQKDQLVCEFDALKLSAVKTLFSRLPVGMVWSEANGVFQIREIKKSIPNVLNFVWNGHIVIDHQENEHFLDFLDETSVSFIPHEYKDARESYSIDGFGLVHDMSSYGCYNYLAPKAPPFGTGGPLNYNMLYTGQHGPYSCECVGDRSEQAVNKGNICLNDFGGKWKMKDVGHTPWLRDQAKKYYVWCSSPMVLEEEFSTKFPNGLVVKKWEYSLLETALSNMGYTGDIPALMDKAKKIGCQNSLGVSSPLVFSSPSQIIRSAKQVFPGVIGLGVHQKIKPGSLVFRMLDSGKIKVDVTAEFDLFKNTAGKIKKIIAQSREYYDDGSWYQGIANNVAKAAYVVIDLFAKGADKVVNKAIKVIAKFLATVLLDQLPSIVKIDFSPMNIDLNGLLSISKSGTDREGQYPYQETKVSIKRIVVDPLSVAQTTTDITKISFKDCLANNLSFTEGGANASQLPQTLLCKIDETQRLIKLSVSHFKSTILALFKVNEKIGQFITDQINKPLSLALDQEMQKNRLEALLWNQTLPSFFSTEWQKNLNPHGGQMSAEVQKFIARLPYPWNQWCSLSEQNVRHCRLLWTVIDPIGSYKLYVNHLAARTHFLSRDYVQTIWAKKGVHNPEPFCLADDNIPMNSNITGPEYYDTNDWYQLHALRDIKVSPNDRLVSASGTRERDWRTQCALTTSFSVQGSITAPNGIGLHFIPSKRSELLLNSVFVCKNGFACRTDSASQIPQLLNQSFPSKPLNIFEFPLQDRAEIAACSLIADLYLSDTEEIPSIHPQTMIPEGERLIEALPSLEEDYEKALDQMFKALTFGGTFKLSPQSGSQKKVLYENFEHLKELGTRCQKILEHTGFSLK
jgi:hypothetical protein